MIEIQRQFNEIISHCFSIDNPKTDEVFSRWKIAKKRFLDAFGEPIYEVGPVQMSLSETAKENKLSKFISELDDTGHYELASFIDANRDGFFKNKTTVDFVLGNKTVPAGVKMLKNFKVFTNRQTDLEKYQNLASNIIQENKVEGILCLSVHPLDYLSLSENCHNWRSCHALDGDYAEGNMSYMLDKSTVICYIKSDKGDIYHLPNFPSSVNWNSKKWRMLLYMSDNDQAMIAGRQYPFAVDNILPMISEKVISLLSLDDLDHISNFLVTLFSGINENENGWSNWDNNYITEYNNIKLTNRHILLNERIYSFDEDFITDGEHSRHYNDLLFSTCYLNPSYCYNKDNTNKIHFSVGEAVPCLVCGKSHAIGLMRCNNCAEEYPIEDEVETCACCGRNIYPEDRSACLYDGSTICFNCFINHTIQCGKCGCSITLTEAEYREDVDDYICPYCSEELREEEN